MLRFSRRARRTAAVAASAAAVLGTTAGVTAPAVSAGVIAPSDRPMAPRAPLPAKRLIVRTVTRASTARRYVTVRSGDSLWRISQRVFGSGRVWPRFYAENKSVIGRDPNMIVPGQHLRASLAAHGEFGATSAVVAAPAAHSAPASAAPSDPVPAPQAAPADPPAVRVSVSGTLSCSGLAALWDAAGGNPAIAWLMAKIGMAESGGRQFAVSPTNDWGYWQIHGAGPAAFDPMTNAHDAISIEGQQGLTAWTTYTSGAYGAYC